jgi:ABC-type transporter Mla maintaining outer membrane lipid asymmetry ATPase subunit MlaF
MVVMDGSRETFEPGGAESIIEVRGLTKRFGSKLVLDNVSLAV